MACEEKLLTVTAMRPVCIRHMIRKKVSIMLRPSIFNDNFTDSLFDNFFGDMFLPAQHMRTASAMTTDIRELPDSYLIDMELPGFSKEHVKAELKDGYMTITAARSEKKDEEDEKGRYVRKERYSGSYSRSFYVGEAVTEKDIQAKFTDGILTVTVPKKEPAPQAEQKRYIAIEG